MSRVINTDSSGKRRNQLMRTGAEILHRLIKKNEIDDETRNMVATLVFVFREIDEGIDQSASAWEKRDYWMKAEELRRRWGWPGRAADQLQDIIYNDRWELLPPIIVKLLPNFQDIKITKMTRKESEWDGSYTRLMADKPPAR